MNRSEGNITFIYQLLAAIMYITKSQNVAVRVTNTKYAAIKWLTCARKIV